MESFVAYVTVDKSYEPPKPVAVHLSRAEARAELDIMAFGDVIASLRIRRARVVMFDS